jgi:hypothetical protein
MMSSPLVGAWEYVSNTRQGFMVLSETHYSMTIASKNRQRIEEPTTDDILEGYWDVNALAGTYTVSGSKVTFNRVANIRVNHIDLPLEAEFTID